MPTDRIASEREALAEVLWRVFIGPSIEKNEALYGAELRHWLLVADAALAALRPEAKPPDPIEAAALVLAENGPDFDQWHPKDMARVMFEHWEALAPLQDRWLVQQRNTGPLPSFRDLFGILAEPAPEPEPPIQLPCKVEHYTSGDYSAAQLVGADGKVWFAGSLRTDGQAALEQVAAALNATGRHCLQPGCREPAPASTPCASCGIPGHAHGEQLHPFVFAAPAPERGERACENCGARVSSIHHQRHCR